MHAPACRWHGLRCLVRFRLLHPHPYSFPFSQPLHLPQLNPDPYAESDSFWQTVVDNLPTATGKPGANNLTSPDTLNLTALLVSGARPERAGAICCILFSFELSSRTAWQKHT